MEFPIYAKHADGSVYYEFISARHFNEWRRLGMSSAKPHFLHTETISKDYFTSLYIKDLLDLVGAGSLVIIDLEEMRKEVLAFQ